MRKSPLTLRWRCLECAEDSFDAYMLEDQVWFEAVGSVTKKGLLHLACVEKRLGRSLTLRDFTNARCNSALRFGYQMGSCNR